MRQVGVLTSTALNLTAAQLPIWLRSRRKILSSLGALLLSLVMNGCAGTSLISNNSFAGNLAVNPSTLTFGKVVFGSSTSKTGTLTATTTGVVVSSAAWEGEGYSVSGITFPTIVPAGKSVPFTVTFVPQMPGSSAGSITFYSNASSSSTKETLIATGTQLSQHRVSLSWDPSTSTVIGYNVYRALTSVGQYSKINSAIDASTNYADSGVQAGQTYYYVTTAVDAVGTESGYSNEVQAVIPNP
jgi:hypothetical protein